MERWRNGRSYAIDCISECGRGRDRVIGRSPDYCQGRCRGPCCGRCCGHGFGSSHSWSWSWAMEATKVCSFLLLCFVFNLAHATVTALPRANVAAAETVGQWFA